ncbi:MAG: hypothetical protein DHS20C18_07650 [Saprospiraceae bacterium]|nr:MAG: hypothetical protein DHS20C18_07650 [Saprospiraceae bacterium]
MLGIIITAIVIWGILNVLAFTRKRVNSIQDEIFEASHTSLEQAYNQNRQDREKKGLDPSGGEKEFAKKASKIVGFFGEQAYGKRGKIPESQYSKVKDGARNLRNIGKKEKKIRLI